MVIIMDTVMDTVMVTDKIEERTSILVSIKGLARLESGSFLFTENIFIGPMHIHFGGQGHQHGHRHHGHNQGHGALHNFHGQCFQRFLHTFHAN